MFALWINKPWKRNDGDVGDVNNMQKANVEKIQVTSKNVDLKKES